MGRERKGSQTRIDESPERSAPSTEPVPAAVADLSYSRLEAFEQCARAFWHAYVDHTPPDGYERVEPWMGTLVHKVLEEALRKTLVKSVPDPVEVLAHYDELWTGGLGPNILVVRDDRVLEDYRVLGRRILKEYLDEAWPFLDATPLHVEEPVGFPVELVDGRTAAFRGIVDRVDRLPDGRLRLIDYKTGKWVPAFKEARDAYQLALYWRGLLARYPETSGGVLVWHYLQQNHTQRVNPSAALVDGAYEWVRRSAAEILRRLGLERGQAAFAPKPGPLCKWCQFGYACDANPYRATAPTPLS